MHLSDFRIPNPAYRQETRRPQCIAAVQRGISRIELLSGQPTVRIDRSIRLGVNWGCFDAIAAVKLPDDAGLRSACAAMLGLLVCPACRNGTARHPSGLSRRMTLSLSIDLRARVACLYAGAVWGLFWIPLRGLETAGTHSLWITAVYFLVPLCCLAPVLLWRARAVFQGGMKLQVTAALAALAITLYSVAIVYTDVVRAMLLFYLTPIWSTLLARAMLRETITPLRILAMASALVGMLTIFGLGANFPLPRNAGDWLGLIAGIVWAFAAVRLNQDRHLPSIDMTVVFFQWAAIYSLAAALALAPRGGPDGDLLLTVLPWLVPVIAIMIVPGTFASLWGPRFLSPGLVGLLFMAEIIVGAISAALLAGEPFGWREVAGVVLIAGASLVEPIGSLLSRDRSAS